MSIEILGGCVLLLLFQVVYLSWVVHRLRLKQDVNTLRLDHHRLLLDEHRADLDQHQALHGLHAEQRALVIALGGPGLADEYDHEDVEAATWLAG